MDIRETPEDEIIDIKLDLARVEVEDDTNQLLFKVKCKPLHGIDADISNDILTRCVQVLAYSNDEGIQRLIKTILAECGVYEIILNEGTSRECDIPIREYKIDFKFSELKDRTLPL